MWIRAELKERAKQVLRGNYWIAFLVSLVIAFATGSGGAGGRNSVSRHSAINPMTFDMNLLRIIGITVTFTFFMAICFRIFVGYPLEVGGRRYFTKSALHDDNSKCFTFAFMGENYMGIVSSMLLKAVYNFLWFLLFIIPGIVKLYAYRMVPYILAESPNIGARRAIEISNEMTYGHKFDMFILDLSFLGWYLLGALAFGIGVFFVLPYHYATDAELYLTLRRYYFEKHPPQA